jgi:hypothetical protein
MNMLEVFKGDPETLEKFITGVDTCLSLYPADSHTYILNIVLAMKMGNSVRSHLPATIQTWAAAKARLLDVYKEITDVTKFHFLLIKATVGEFPTIFEFLEYIERNFGKYKRAIQYSNPIQAINHRVFIDNLIEQISRCVEPFIISMAAQAGSFPEAIEIVKSKIKRKEESSRDKADENSDILKAIRSEIKMALDNHRTISQNEGNSRQRNIENSLNCNDRSNGNFFNNGNNRYRNDNDYFRRNDNRNFNRNSNFRNSNRNNNESYNRNYDQHNNQNQTNYNQNFNQNPNVYNNSNRNFDNTRRVHTAHASDLNSPINQPQIQYVYVPVNSQMNNDTNNCQPQMMQPNNIGHMQHFPQGHLNGQSNAQL